MERGRLNLSGLGWRWGQSRTTPSWFLRSLWPEGRHLVSFSLEWGHVGKLSPTESFPSQRGGYLPCLVSHGLSSWVATSQFKI